MGTFKNLKFRDETQGVAQKMTRHIMLDRREMSEHTTPRFARKMDYWRFTHA